MLNKYAGLKLIQTEGQNKTELERTQTEHPSAAEAESSECCFNQRKGFKFEP